MWTTNIVTASFGLLLHNSEAVDPVLIEWIKHKIDEIFGVSAMPIVIVLGALMLVFPIGLMALVWRRARRARGRRL
jgi:hypothetical protein